MSWTRDDYTGLEHLQSLTLFYFNFDFLDSKRSFLGQDLIQIVLQNFLSQTNSFCFGFLDDLSYYFENFPGSGLLVGRSENLKTQSTSLDLDFKLEYVKRQWACLGALTPSKDEKNNKQKKGLIFDSTFEDYSELSIILKVGEVFLHEKGPCIQWLYTSKDFWKDNEEYGLF